MGHKILVPTFEDPYLQKMSSYKVGDEGRLDPLLQRSDLSDVGFWSVVSCYFSYL